jgi:predicted phosphodiesterase
MSRTRSLKRCFQYFSDLHLERKRDLPKIPQHADNLLLAGDIGHPDMENYQEFFEEVNKRYDRVFVVDGNHEWDQGRPDPERFKHLPNVILLNNQHYEWNGVVVIGATLWTEATRAYEHVRSVDFLSKTLEAYEPFDDKPVIVLTHHLPSWHLIAPQYRHFSPKVLERYASHLDYLFYRKSSPDVWVCGHSHSLMNRKMGLTQCVINTLGQKYFTKICL